MKHEVTLQICCPLKTKRFCFEFCLLITSSYIWVLCQIFVVSALHKVDFNPAVWKTLKIGCNMYCRLSLSSRASGSDSHPSQSIVLFWNIVDSFIVLVFQVLLFEIWLETFIIFKNFVLSFCLTVCDDSVNLVIMRVEIRGAVRALAL